MPWSVERTGETLHVRIEAPVGDWTGLLQGLAEAQLDTPLAVYLPARIPHGDAADQERLEVLW